MASGQKRMQLNTRERVISTDHNRLQSFLGAHVSEMLRWMTLAAMAEGGASVMGTTTTSPLNAMILNGLWARPEIGTVNLFVEPGAIAMINPDGAPSADDSACKVFSDAGVTVAGSLTLTAGGGGATRIDVIECSRVEAVTESDNRDIFNPGTALFTPTLVDKVKLDRLTYRIRTGTAGAGFPGTASGWLPLAVAIVPQTATTWNDCIVFDVRPLLMDLAAGGAARVVKVFPKRPKGFATMATVIAASPLTSLRGIAESEFGQWRVGGEFAPALAGLTNNAIDMTSAELLETGFVAVANRPWYVYAMFPHGLPRWARYSPSSSGQRIPLPFKGIPVLTTKPPANGQHATVSSAVTMPAIFGFTATQTAGVPIMTGGTDDGGAMLDTSLFDGWTMFGRGGTATGQNVGELLTIATGAGTNTQLYDLVDNTDIPVGAVAVRVRFSCILAFSNGAQTAYTMQRRALVYDTTNALTGQLYGPTDNLGGSSAGSGNVTVSWEVEIPLNCLASMPTGAPVTRRVGVEWTVTPHTGTVAFGTERAWVVGWRLGVD